MQDRKLEGIRWHTFSKILSERLDLIFFSFPKRTANYTFCTNWETRMATGWPVCRDSDLITACHGTPLRIKHQCYVQPPLYNSLRSQGLSCLLTLSVLSSSTLGHFGLSYLQFQGETLFVTCFYVVSVADPMRNVSWILFQEGRSSELKLRQGVEQAAHTLNNSQVESTGVLLCVIKE